MRVIKGVILTVLISDMPAHRNRLRNPSHYPKQVQSTGPLAIQTRPFGHMPDLCLRQIFRVYKNHVPGDAWLCYRHRLLETVLAP